MAISDTTNMAGSVGTSAANATRITFGAAPLLSDPLPKTITIAIAGTGNARIGGINGAAADAVRDSIAAGGGMPAVLAAPQGVKSVLIYADSSESGLTYQIIKNISNLN